VKRRHFSAQWLRGSRTPSQGSWAEKNEKRRKKLGQWREGAQGAEFAGQFETRPAELARSGLRDQSIRGRNPAPVFWSPVVFFGQPPAWLRASAVPREI
jgi:hypothetical protein